MSIDQVNIQLFDTEKAHPKTRVHGSPEFLQATLQIRHAGRDGFSAERIPDADQRKLLARRGPPNVYEASYSVRYKLKHPDIDGSDALPQSITRDFEILFVFRPRAILEYANQNIRTNTVVLRLMQTFRGVMHVGESGLCEDPFSDLKAYKSAPSRGGSFGDVHLENAVLARRNFAPVKHQFFLQVVEDASRVRLATQPGLIAGCVTKDYSFAYAEADNMMKITLTPEEYNRWSKTMHNPPAGVVFDDAQSAEITNTVTRLQKAAAAATSINSVTHMTEATASASDTCTFSRFRDTGQRPATDAEADDVADMVLD